ncbi:MAG: endonuclease domain-containing protein [Elusimicrobiota bacterium]
MSRLIPRSRALRRSMTNAEKLMWHHLRLRQAGVKFRRQTVMGRYIVDFVCFSEKLVIEIDGGQHCEQSCYDSRRTAWLRSQGFTVLRFWNHDVLRHIDAVKQAVFAELTPHLNPPPQGGRRR